jgi:hypothetical protein
MTFGSLPSGGTAGQVLEKQSGVDGDADWADPVTASGILTLLLTTDGEGSGLDADTLDGVQADGFLRVTDTTVSGQWDTSTNDPDADVRLNYDGYLYATRVYNTWYNDLADMQQLHPDVYTFYPGKVYYQTGRGLKVCNKYAQKGAVGIASDTYGFCLGKADSSQVPIAVAGFVLAYCDRHSPGTPLVVCPTGSLVKAPWYIRLLFSERILATYYKDEDSYTVGPNNIHVNNRNWVRVR